MESQVIGIASTSDISLNMSQLLLAIAGFASLCISLMSFDVLNKNTQKCEINFWRTRQIFWFCIIGFIVSLLHVLFSQESYTHIIAVRSCSAILGLTGLLWPAWVHWSGGASNKINWSMWSTVLVLFIGFLVTFIQILNAIFWDRYSILLLGIIWYMVSCLYILSLMIRDTLKNNAK